MCIWVGNMKSAIVILGAALCALQGAVAAERKEKLSPDRIEAAIGQKGYAIISFQGLCVCCLYTRHWELASTPY